MNGEGNQTPPADVLKAQQLVAWYLGLVLGAKAGGTRAETPLHSLAELVGANETLKRWNHEQIGKLDDDKSSVARVAMVMDDKLLALEFAYQAYNGDVRLMLEMLGYKVDIGEKK